MRRDSRWITSGLSARRFFSGCSSVEERGVRDAEAAGAIPATQTASRRSSTGRASSFHRSLPARRAVGARFSNSIDRMPVRIRPSAPCCAESVWHQPRSTSSRRCTVIWSTWFESKGAAPPALSSTAERSPDKRVTKVRFLQSGLWSMPKQSRREAVNLEKMGASPIDHPKGVLTVKEPSWSVEPLLPSQLGASPSTPTHAAVDQR